MTNKAEKYLLYNNQFHKTDDPIFKVANRSFRYGDGLFETIRVIKGQIHLLDYHIERLLNGTDFLKIERPSNWNTEFFRKRIWELLEKNGEKENGKIRLSIFRADGGLYTPKTNKANFLIEFEEYNQPEFLLNKKGLKIDIFSEMEKACNLYSNFKTSNALVYILASIHKREEGLDDCLIVNSQNRIAEAISSNVFMVKDGKVITPPLSEGCVAGIMRSHVLDIMQKHNIDYQVAPIQLEELFSAQELFMSDAIKGIRWVSSFKVMRYELGLAKQISEYLNQEVEALAKGK